MKLRKMKLSKIIVAVFMCALISVGEVVSAQVVISEVMYDLKTGSDEGREWVEILNSGPSAVAVATSTWRFFENNKNHELSLFQGDALISDGGFAVIVDNPQKFLADWPGFAGTIFDSSFSLLNDGTTVGIKSNSSTIVDQFSSSMGGAGDGNSLQKINGVWQGRTPTPGIVNFRAEDSNSDNSKISSSTDSVAKNSFSETNANSSDSSLDGNKSYWPIEPQIFSKIIGPNTTIAGADVVFKGEAVGAEKKPLQNARFLWNFGDGATAEGESVKHIYNFPGKYVVILEVSSGKNNGGSRLEIEAIQTPISIKNIVSGLNGQIVISNESNREIDLSFWILKGGNLTFSIPKNTKILSKGELSFASAVTGINWEYLSAQILYPNGSLAYFFEKKSSPAVTLPPLNQKPSSESLELKPSVVSVKENQSEKLESRGDLSFQTASVATAMEKLDNGSSTVSAPVKNSSSGSQHWLYFLGGIIVLGVGAVVWPRNKGETKEANEADSIKIIEE